MSDSQLDLSRLALSRPGDGRGGGKPRRRRWVTPYVLPVGVLLGFVGLLAAAAGARLMPRKPVTVLPVVVTRSEVQQAGTVLFQAAGWIEPRPTSISVAALAPGVVEELLVVEGQQVDRGEPIARLVEIDARLAVRRAEATLAIREGELHRAEAELRAAEQRLANPVHLQAQLAEAQGALARIESELAKLPFLIEAAKARVDYTQADMEGKRAAGPAVSARVLNQAVSSHLTADADLRELQQREPILRREVAALRDQVQALTQQRQLLIEESRQQGEARAKVESAIALRDEAAVALEVANLMLQRTTIKAPIAGRILRLVAAPGTRVMGLEATADQAASTVVEMYDPDRLQVRADVRLEDVPLVQPNQPVRVETASSAEPIEGRVLLATSAANIQKNTLEVKVELIDPPPTVRPEMLVTASFLAPQTPETEPTEESTERILVPKQLVQSSDAGSFLWLVDADERASRRTISVGSAGNGDLVEVTNGLEVTDKLIANGFAELEPGDRVEVTGEDQTIGIQ